MKKILGALLLVGIAGVAYSQVSFSNTKFSQDFSSSTTVADYTGPSSSANTSLFTNIAVTGSNNNVSSSITSNALVFSRTAASGAAGFRMVRGNSTITVADAPFTAVKFQFDLKLNVTAAPGTTLDTGLVFGVGDAGTTAYSANATNPSSTDSWAWFSAQIPSSGSTYNIRSAGGTNGSTSLSYNTNYTITLFANAGASSLSYTNPSGGTSIVAAGAYDIWINTTREFAGLSSTNSTIALEAFKINHTSGSSSLAFTAAFDNVLVATAVPEPSSFAAIAGFGSLAWVFMRRRRTA